MEVRVREMPPSLTKARHLHDPLPILPRLRRARVPCAPGLPTLGAKLWIQPAVRRLFVILRARVMPPSQTRAVQPETHRAALRCSTTDRLRARPSLPTAPARLKPRLVDS